MQCVVQVCESCVEHCGPAFHEQLAVGPFFKRIRQAVLEPDNPRVRALYAATYLCP